MVITANGHIFGEQHKILTKQTFIWVYDAGHFHLNVNLHYWQQKYTSNDNFFIQFSMIYNQNSRA